MEALGTWVYHWPVHVRGTELLIAPIHWRVSLLLIMKKLKASNLVWFSLHAVSWCFRRRLGNVEYRHACKQEKMTTKPHFRLVLLQLLFL